MKNVFIFLFFFALALTACEDNNNSAYPRIYVKESDKPVIQQKIKDEGWAKDAYARLKSEIDAYADRHAKDPEWIVSRLSMYWKDGERYTQCYLKEQNWDRGEGNAPVPTVRMPGMRIWNKYSNVPLEDRIPYNETGDMWGIDRTNPALPPVLVPYKESGHMIRLNNREILALAEKSSFLYWLSGEQKYAQFAADIFYTWLLGTYYMNPILDPEKSTGGYGGYEPGGICGYYDYEQIHDDLAMHAAITYDFLHAYLDKHPHPHLVEIEKSLTEVAGIVFKRFIDIGFVRGGRTGNWNVNGWNIMLCPILALEDNAFYPDGKGREYYLHYLTTESTEYHQSIPDIVKTYDSVTGLWPESPGYAFSTIDMLLDFAVMLKNSGIDIIASNPILQKSAMAILPWMDEQANMVVFGDCRGGSVNFMTLENLLTYYTGQNDKEAMRQVASALNTGVHLGKHKRTEIAGWKELCTFVSSIPEAGEIETERASYSPFHRFITMKNFNGSNKLMATLYGGKEGHHLSANGLSMQLYGFGYALAPDAAAYESYWSADVAYHQTATGCNTIMPGYTEGDITICAMEPSLEADEFVNSKELNPFIGFADVAADEKRRTLAVVRTSPETGYYVDIFRSDLSDNDYIYHNLGTELQISDFSGRPLPQKEVKSMGTTYSKGYNWFTHPRQTNFEHGIKAKWDITEVHPSISMYMWMTGAKGREIFQVDAPYTSLNASLTPEGVCTPPSVTPTLIVRQNGNNAWENPFIAVFEPVKGGNNAVTQVESYTDGNEMKGVVVSSLDNRKDYILSSTKGELSQVDNTQFQGIFGVVTELDGKVEMLYLGKGKLLEKAGCSISSSQEVYASVYKENGVWYYSSDADVVITLDGKSKAFTAGYHVKVNI